MLDDGYRNDRVWQNISWLHWEFISLCCEMDNGLIVLLVGWKAKWIQEPYSSRNRSSKYAPLGREP